MYSSHIPPRRFCCWPHPFSPPHRKLAVPAFLSFRAYLKNSLRLHLSVFSAISALESLDLAPQNHRLSFLNWRKIHLSCRLSLFQIRPMKAFLLSTLALRRNCNGAEDGHSKTISLFSPFPFVRAPLRTFAKRFVSPLSPRPEKSLNQRGMRLPARHFPGAPQSYCLSLVSPGKGVFCRVSPLM